LVRRYFCFELLGVSGMVNSKKPELIKGFKIPVLNFDLLVLFKIFINSAAVLSGAH
jgi:hypothetical protein